MRASPDDRLLDECIDRALKLGQPVSSLQRQRAWAAVRARAETLDQLPCLVPVERPRSLLCRTRDMAAAILHMLADDAAFIRAQERRVTRKLSPNHRSFHHGGFVPAY